MKIARTDAHQPNLRFRQSLVQLIAGRQFIGIDFVSATLDIDRHDFPLVRTREMRLNLARIDFVAAASEFLFAVTPVSGCHANSPTQSKPWPGWACWSSILSSTG